MHEAVLNAAILRRPEPSQTFVLETDASSGAVGSVIKQSDGTLEYPVAFYSMALSKPERNYTAYDR